MQNMYNKHAFCIFPTLSMAQKNIQVRLDETLKNKAEKIFKRIGIDTPTAVRMFFVKVTDFGGIPFSVVQDDYHDNYTPEQLAEFDRMAEEAMSDPSKLIGPFSSAKELIRSLHEHAE